MLRANNVIACVLGGALLGGYFHPYGWIPGALLGIWVGLTGPIAKEEDGSDQSNSVQECN